MHAQEHVIAISFSAHTRQHVHPFKSIFLASVPFIKLSVCYFAFVVNVYFKINQNQRGVKKTNLGLSPSTAPIYHVFAHVYCVVFSLSRKILLCWNVRPLTILVNAAIAKAPALRIYQIWTIFTAIFSLSSVYFTSSAVLRFLTSI